MKKFEKWNVAYRRRQNDDTLLENPTGAFTVIPNSWRFWYADPHLIAVRGKNYIFAEAYDRVLRRGVIHYCELTGNSVFAWKPALKMPFHLSYPHLLTDGEDIYMIPESYVADEIAVYRAVSFPDKWEKRYVLKSDFCAVDTTVFTWEHSDYMLTLRFSDDNEYLTLFSLNDAGIDGDGCTITVNDAQKRPAGNFFSVDGTLYRPAQDCSDSYGCALNFYRITALGRGVYDEALARKLYPDSLVTDLPVPPRGIHTYNFNEAFEVIDLKRYEIDLLFYVMRPVWFVFRRLKKVFRI